MFKKVGGGSFNFISSKGHANLEFALESSELIIGKKGLSREDAIKKLMEVKFLMEMDVITNKEFEHFKNKLTPIIKTD